MNVQKQLSLIGKQVLALPIKASSQQGMAVWQNWVFLLHHGGKCDLYDLNSCQAIAHFPLGSYTGEGVGPYVNHANQAVFSAQKYFANDEFPLMYVSVGNGPGADEKGYYGRCAVERILFSGKETKSEMLQIISYCDNNEPVQENGKYLNAPLYEPPCWGLPAFFPDFKHKRLYLFSARYRTTLRDLDNQNAYLITTFHLPDVQQSQDVILMPEDIIAQKEYAFDFGVTQGGTLFGKYLLQAFGFGTTEAPNGILCFDLKQGYISCRIDLSESIFAEKELEDCAIWGTKLVCNTRDGAVYVLCDTSELLP